jgi:hypothetical protein
MTCDTVKVNNIPRSNSGDVGPRSHHGSPSVADRHLIIIQQQAALGLLLLLDLLDH